MFDHPDPVYVTGRIDISAFAQVGAATPWPFVETNVPLNGLVRVPRGRGPFPLVVFAHGNHDPLENSTPGYLYLCEFLASHGIVAATIDVNFLNGSNFGENDAHAIVHLEHLKQFRKWNASAAHPLRGKIDQNRIMIVGHSRGGEGVGHVSFFIQHQQESPSFPEISSPVQGQVFADALNATRQFFDLVNASAPVPKLALQLQWAGLGAFQEPSSCLA
jgi:hypothetical protein